MGCCGGKSGAQKARRLSNSVTGNISTTQPQCNEHRGAAGRLARGSGSRPSYYQQPPQQHAPPPMQGVDLTRLAAQAASCDTPPQGAPRGRQPSTSNTPPARRGSTQSTPQPAALSPQVGLEGRVGTAKAPEVTEDRVSRMLTDDCSRYEMGPLLGRGQFGQVYRAVDKQTGETVAVKTVDPGAKSRMGEKRLHREICLLAALDHPHIVRFVSLVLDPKSASLWIVLELVEGEELSDVLKSMSPDPARQYLASDTARKYFQQLITAVHYMHTQSIAHRDLKPSNLMINTVIGVLKVTDFGLSNVQETDEDGNVRTHMALLTSCGTPYYVAPEVVPASGKEKGYSGFKSDIWSMGVILYNMLTGQLPFNGRTLSDLLPAIRKGRYKVPSHVPPGAAEVLRRIFVVNPKERIELRTLAQLDWIVPGFPAGGMDTVEMGVHPSAMSLVSTRVTMWSLRSTPAVDGAEFARQESVPSEDEGLKPLPRQVTGGGGQRRDLVREAFDEEKRRRAQQAAEQQATVT